MRLFFSLFFLCSLAFSSEVTHTGITLRHLLVSQEKEAPFKGGDYLCVVQHDEEVACGFVEKVEERGVLIDLEFRAEDVKIGSPVQRATKRRPCDPNFSFRTAVDPILHQPLQDPFSRSCTTAEQSSASSFRVPFSRFFSIGMGALSPRVAGEVAFEDNYAAGISVDLRSFYSSLPSFKASSSGTAFGGTVFFAFYPFSLFENAFVHFGAGYFKGRMTLRGDLNDWSGTLVYMRIGYRILNWQGFGLGLSLGGEHYSFKNPEDPMRTEFLAPSALLEFGAAL